MKPVFYPGTGFPGRLQRHLYLINKRPADVERDTRGLIKSETVRGWLKGKHFPEKHNFLQFCRHYRIDGETAQELLRGPSDHRDAELLERQTSAGRLLADFKAGLEAVVGSYGSLDDDHQRQVIAELEGALQRIRGGEVLL